jgi:hypothetical protein
VKAPDQDGGSIDGLGAADDRVAPCVEPNSHGGIGDGYGGKEMRWIGTPMGNGVGAVVTTAGAVAAESIGQDGGGAHSPTVRRGEEPIIKSWNSLCISVWMVVRLRKAAVNCSFVRAGTIVDSPDNEVTTAEETA